MVGEETATGAPASARRAGLVEVAVPRARASPRVWTRGALAVGMVTVGAALLSSCSAADRGVVLDPQAAPVSSGAASPGLRPTIGTVSHTSAHARPGDASGGPGVSAGARSDPPSAPGPDTTLVPGGSTSPGAAPGQSATNPPAGIEDPVTDPSHPGVTPAVPEGPAPEQARDAGTSRTTYLIECVDQDLTREPVRFTPTCDGAREALDALSWQQWGAARATAKGIAVANDCRPTCATGTVHRFPVTVVASGLARGDRSGVYTALSVRYLGKVPAGRERVRRYVLPS